MEIFKIKKPSRSQSLDSKASHDSGMGMLSPRSIAPKIEDLVDPLQHATMSPGRRDDGGGERDQVLLKFLKDISELVSDREKKRNPPQLISDFQSVARMQQEFNDMKDSIEGLRDQLDRRLTPKLAALPMAVDPPTYFSPVNKLDNNERLRDSVQKHWPSVGNKVSVFRGTRQDDLSVRQYLANLTSLQQAYCLSEQEFLAQVKKGCAGVAFDFVEANLIGGACSPRQLYTYMLHRFDRSLPPELARRKLHALSATRRDNLARLLGQVLTYVTQASLLIPSQYRRIWSDQEGCASIIKSLPSMSRAFARQKLVELQGTTKDIIPSLNHFGEVLTAHQEMINEDIEMNGQPGRMNMEIREIVKEEQKEHRARADRKDSSLKEDRIRGTSQSLHEGDTERQSRPFQKEIQNRQPRGEVRGLYNRNQNQPRFQGQERQPFGNNGRQGQFQNQDQGFHRNQMGWQGRGQFGENNGQRSWNGGFGRGRGANFTPLGNSGGLRGRDGGNRNNYGDQQEFSSNSRWCRLCGQKSHIAADQCYSMRNQDGTVAKVLPTKEVCTECASFTRVGLHHPVRYCIFRPEVQKYLNKAKLDAIRKK